MMKYAIVFSSKTGNTRALAQAVARALPQENCLYFGPPAQEALRAPVVYAGFWTDKGTCDSDTAAFLSSLTTQQVFLFGTAGFGGSAAYFDKIMDAVQAHVPSSVRVIGRWMCQGKMAQGVRLRYEAMEDSPRRTAMLENFDRALSHPDSTDLAEIQKAVQATQ